MNGRLVLGTIVFLAVGVLVLPPTVSLFVGQHDWYDIDATGNQIPCQKCHADVFAELNNSPYHKGWGTSGVADEDDCRGCHQANQSIAYASGTTNGPTDNTLEWGAHAASTIECMYCHDQKQVGGAPVAGGFGISGLANDTGSLAAHFDFVSSADLGSDVLLAENEACIACHTHVAVKINFTHYGAMEFDVNWDTGLQQYATSNYTINTSTAVVNVIWGNATGQGWVNTYPGSANWPGQ